MKIICLKLVMAVALICNCHYSHIAAQTSSGVPVSKRITLRLDPGPDNPRNTEGDFITLKDGRILYVYSKYSGNSTSDHAPAFLAGRYSGDGGKTWSNTDEIIVEKEGLMNVMSVSLVRLNPGQIALFYLRKNSVTDCIPMMRTSSDEGKTWSDAITCIRDREGYFVLNNDRVIRLKNGRLLMPVALHTSPEGNWQEKANLFCYYSDDEGRSWQSAEVPDNTTLLTQEPGVVELGDGRILIFIRASGGVQLFSYSTDGGQSWSAVEKSTIRSPISPASVSRIPGGHKLLLVWNDNDDSNPRTGNQRTPLNLAISTDHGKTWSHKKTIENDPDGWFCYTAIHFHKKHLLLGYISGSQSRKAHLSASRIVQIRLKDIVE